MTSLEIPFFTTTLHLFFFFFYAEAIILLLSGQQKIGVHFFAGTFPIYLLSLKAQGGAITCGSYTQYISFVLKLLLPCLCTGYTALYSSVFTLIIPSPSFCQPC